MTPPSVGTFLLYAQGQQIGHLPLNGTRLQKDMAKTLLSLHVKCISLWAVQGFQMWEREVLEAFRATGHLHEPAAPTTESGGPAAGSHV